jgi:CheY-like chemotaxis protein
VLPFFLRGDGIVTGMTGDARVPRLLLAEDNDVNQRVALLLLQSVGVEADVAADGARVLELVEENSYDAILMDVQMPKMDGITATREIRKRWPDGGPVIIGLTAEDRDEDRRACLEAGMDRYLTKPLTRDKLDEVLDALMSVEPDRLAGLRSTIGHAKLAELIDDCVIDAVALLDRMDRALAQRDDDDLRRAAHMLSSTASIMGAGELAAACIEVQAAVRNGDSATARAEAARLRAMFDEARAKIRPEA